MISFVKIGDKKQKNREAYSFRKTGKTGKNREKQGRLPF